MTRRPVLTTRPVDEPLDERYDNEGSVEAMGLGSICIQLPVCDCLCPVMLGDLPTVQKCYQKRSVCASFDRCQRMVTSKLASTHLPSIYIHHEAAFAGLHSLTELLAVRFSLSYWLSSSRCVGKCRCCCGHCAEGHSRIAQKLSHCRSVPYTT